MTNLVRNHGTALGDRIESYTTIDPQSWQKDQGGWKEPGEHQDQHTGEHKVQMKNRLWIVTKKQDSIEVKLIVKASLMTLGSKST